MINFCPDLKLSRCFCLLPNLQSSVTIVTTTLGLLMILAMRSRCQTVLYNSLIPALSPMAILLCFSICPMTSLARPITTEGNPANLPASMP